MHITFTPYSCSNWLPSSFIGALIPAPQSARNQIEGVVKKIEKGEVASVVKIEIAEPHILTSMLTKEAVEDLDLKEGDKVEAVIKATEILILKE